MCTPTPCVSHKRVRKLFSMSIYELERSIKQAELVSRALHTMLEVVTRATARAAKLEHSLSIDEAWNKTTLKLLRHLEDDYACNEVISDVWYTLRDDIGICDIYRANKMLRQNYDKDLLSTEIAFSPLVNAHTYLFNLALRVTPASTDVLNALAAYSAAELSSCECDKCGRSSKRRRRYREDSSGSENESYNERVQTAARLTELFAGALRSLFTDPAKVD